MWEHYAEDHAGVCLVFDREELLQALRQDLARTGAFWENPVEYTVAGFADSEAGAITTLGNFTRTRWKRTWDYTSRGGGGQLAERLLHVLGELISRLLSGRGLRGRYGPSSAVPPVSVD